MNQMTVLVRVDPGVSHLEGEIFSHYTTDTDMQQTDTIFTS